MRVAEATLSLYPEVTGSVAIRSPAAGFLRAFEQRVALGLLSGTPHARSSYRVTSSGPDRLVIEAATAWTATNVGLNVVDLRIAQPGAVNYRVQYWRWASFCIGLCGLLGLIGIVLLLTTDARAYMDRTALGMVPGLSADQNLAIAWGMAIFWGFVWPWIMIGWHKRPLHKLMARLISEVDARAEGR